MILFQQQTYTLLLSLLARKSTPMTTAMPLQHTLTLASSSTTSRLARRHALHQRFSLFLKMKRIAIHLALHYCHTIQAAPCSRESQLSTTLRVRARWLVLQIRLTLYRHPARRHIVIILARKWLYSLMFRMLLLDTCPIRRMFASSQIHL